MTIMERVGMVHVSLSLGNHFRQIRWTRQHAHHLHQTHHINPALELLFKHVCMYEYIMHSTSCQSFPFHQTGCPLPRKSPLFRSHQSGRKLFMLPHMSERRYRYFVPVYHDT